MAGVLKRWAADRPEGVARKGGLDGYGWPESSCVPYYSLWAGPKVTAGLPQPVRPNCSALIQATKKAYLKRYTKKNDKKGHLDTERENVFFKTTVLTSRAGVNIKQKMRSDEQSRGEYYPEGGVKLATLAETGPAR